MFAQLFLLVFLLLVCAVIAFKSFITIKDGEYGVVFRLGKLHQAHGPGAIMIVPFLDRVVRIPVHQILNWQTMSRDELEKKVVDLALRQP